MAITARALAFVLRWFDPRTVATVFDPLVADWQREWLDAPRSRRAIIHLKGFLSLCVAIVVSAPALLGTRAPKPLAYQVARRIAVVTAIGAAILVLPFVRQIELLELRALLILLVIPQAITVAFPFAVVPAVDAIRKFPGVETHVTRVTAARLAVLAVVVVSVMDGWVVPAANQAWRRATFHPPTEPARAPRELTTFELVARSRLPRANGPGTHDFYTVRNARRELNNRAALAALPVLLLWRRWRALDLPAGRWFAARSAAIGTVATIGAFFTLQYFIHVVEMNWQLRFGSLWLTVALFVSLGVLRVTLAERTAHRDPRAVAS